MIWRDSLLTGTQAFDLRVCTVCEAEWPLHSVY